MGLYLNIKYLFVQKKIELINICTNFRKEAQRCFCEATNCRGWIGDNPEDSKAKILYTEDIEDTEEDTEDDTEDKEQKENKEEKPEKQVKRKREEKKITDHMEDEDVSIHKDALLKYFKINFVQLCMRNPISDVCGQCLIQTFRAREIKRYSIF